MPSIPIKILMAQINPTVGAISENIQKILEIIRDNQKTHDLIVFPELAITGYPPEDLLFRKELYHAVEISLNQIKAITENCYIIVGHPTLKPEGCYNSLSVFHKGIKIRQYH